MIYLNQDTTNNVVLTLTENVTLTGDTFYLFEFISDDTRYSKLFTTEDLSTNTCRFNQFNITVTDGAENLTGGTINLAPVGYYKYNVYQMSDPTNLAISGTSGIVETGKLYLSGDTKPNMISYDDNSSKDNDLYIAYE